MQASTEPMYIISTFEKFSAVDFEQCIFRLFLYRNWTNLDKFQVNRSRKLERIRLVIDFRKRELQETSNSLTNQHEAFFIPSHFTVNVFVFIFTQAGTQVTFGSIAHKKCHMILPLLCEQSYPLGVFWTSCVNAEGITVMRRLIQVTQQDSNDYLCPK